MDRTEMTAEDLDKEVREIKKAFEVLLLAIEAEGIESASGIAERIVARLDAVIGEMKEHYVRVVLDKKFRAFGDDQRRFEAFKASEKRSSEEFIDIVGRIERHIGVVDRELRMLAPQPPRFVHLAKVHWKKGIIVAAGLLVVVGVWSAVNSFKNRGKGLIGEYYTGTNFRKMVRRRRDLKIDFVLKNKSPIHGLTYDNFSVRWNGFLRVPVDGTYQILTRSDDGVRVWIDGEPVIDNWTVHRLMTDKATRVLKAGLSSIKIEWYQKKGGATMQLMWQMEGDAQPKIIE
ncbi:MAG: hypothetical protein JO102_05020, partial [Elusimicrobia bacterium]|nr:hypothetical protein [Elusimicrobiota bacterium]